MSPMQGPLIPKQSHTATCWPLPRSGDNPPPREGACDCPLITGDAYPKRTPRESGSQPDRNGAHMSSKIENTRKILRTTDTAILRATR